jgi:hypothetical protein
MLILGIVGTSNAPDRSEGAGKSTVCNMIRTHMLANGLSVDGYSFAEPLKQICYDVYGKAFGVPRHAFYGTQAQKNEPIPQLPGWTGRKIMQHVGETFKGVSRSVWANLLMANATASDKTLVVIDDVRFEVEAEAIVHNGGKIVWLKRGENLEYPLCTPYDIVVDNHGRSIVELADAVRGLLCDLHFLPSTQKQQA